MHRMPLLTPLVAGCLLALGCGDYPEPVAPDTPIALQVVSQECTDITAPKALEDLVRVDPALPRLETLSTVFHAQAGEDQRLEFRFAGQGAPGTHTWLLRLRLREETLPEDVDVVIEATVDQALDGTVLFSVQFQLEPEVVFNPAEPAELQFHVSVASGEFLADVDDFRVFRQEEEGDLYVCNPSELDIPESTISVEVESFTRYALAIGR